jgi:hypothetical protein
MRPARPRRINCDPCSSPPPWEPPVSCASSGRLRPPLVPFGLTAIVLAAGWLPPGFRAWLSALDVRWLDRGEGRARTFCSSDDYSTLMTELECDAVLFDLDGVLVDSPPRD